MTLEEMYLHYRDQQILLTAMQRQITELVRYTNDLNLRLARWEPILAKEYQGLFAAETKDVTDEKDLDPKLKPPPIPDDMMRGFLSTLETTK